MTLLQRTMVALAAVAALGAVPIQAARADVLPAVGSPTVTPVRWEYAVVLSNTQNLKTADFFVIYDFGHATSVLAPPGWSLSSDPLRAATVTNPTTVTPTQTNAQNWTFTWTGGPVTGNPSAQIRPETFSLASTSGSPSVEAFVGDGASPQINLSDGIVPNTQVAVANPEPATLVLLGTGMLGLVGFARRRNK